MRLAKRILGVIACLFGFILLGLVILQIPQGIFNNNLWSAIMQLSGGVLILAIGAWLLFNS